MLYCKREWNTKKKKKSIIRLILICKWSVWWNAIIKVLISDKVVMLAWWESDIYRFNDKVIIFILQRFFSR
jgi:hypothetical protein